MEEEAHEKMMNLRARRKKSSVGILCCFIGATQHHRSASFDATSYSTSHPSPRRSTFKSRTNDLPEIKGKCRNFISRMTRRRGHSSVDFSYDPLSYSLNFDHDASSAAADEDFHAVSFSARLPLSPPRRTTAPFNHDLLKPPQKGGSGDLSRRFEALSVSMKASSPLGGQMRSSKSTDQLSEAATVAENSTTPVATSDDAKGSIEKIFACDI